ncbi:MAG: D-alanine--D-alanine ligase [Armatimonadetes bacterium]|nr:D-alanine--D-alanine ligase [Armatimonadota bacterium]MDW8123063.1 D-alanine--D-alanine ligase [Armatimonadota bacterium]
MNRLLVLFGGDSPEREISLRSGQAVATTLRKMGHSVVTADLSYAYERGTPSPPSESDLKGTPKDLPRFLQSVQPDVVFPIFHGGYGEDGTLQALLELWDVPYASPPPIACFLSMDKIHFKRLLTAEGISTPAYIVVEKSQWQLSGESVYDQVRQFPGFPCVVKPSRQGSTIGASVVEDDSFSVLQEALAQAFEYDDQVLVEKKIVGTEVTIGVLGSGSHLRPLPPVEIIPLTPFFDYQTKYTPHLAKHRVPPDLPSETIASAVETAVKVHRLLSCRGVTRTDMICDRSGRLFVLELNAIPGMTEVSIVPEMARHAGIGFEGLLEAMLKEALQVAKEKTLRGGYR